MPRKAILSREQLQDVVRLLKHEPFESAAEQLNISTEALTKYLNKHLFSDDDWTQSQYTSFFAYFVNPAKKPNKKKMKDGSKEEVVPRWNWAEFPWSVSEREMRIEKLRQRLMITGLNLEQIFEVTLIERMYWRQFVASGFVRSEYFLGRMRVPFTELARLVHEHPEVFKYMNVPERLQRFFQFADAGHPPRYKLITCRSSHIDTKVLVIPGKHGRSETTLEIQSCGDMGGVRFWAAMYSMPTCPRCGLRTSRISEEAKFADEPSGEDEVRNALATKMGLRWIGGSFKSQEGATMSDVEVDAFIAQITCGHSRERDRKLRLVQEIKEYKTKAAPKIL